MSEPNFEASAPSSEQIGATSVASMPTRKQEFNIYTLMLILAFVALLAGTILLFIEVNKYGSFPGSPWDTSSATPTQISWLVTSISQHFV